MSQVHKQILITQNYKKSSYQIYSIHQTFISTITLSLFILHTHIQNTHSYMKKHLTSIQSTRPAEDISIISYDDRQMKLNYKNQILKVLSHMHSVLTLRSYLLFRDIQQILQNSQNFFFKILCISTPQELFSFAFPHKKQNEKIHQKQQIAFLVKLVLEIDKIRKAAANQGRTKDFQVFKGAMELLEQKIPEYEQAIRQKKYNDKLQKKMMEKDERETNFSNFQQAIKQNLLSRQQNIKASFLQKLHHENETAYFEIQKKSTRNMYKVKPSKFLSEAKDLSLRAKLSPYASELKRDYDYKTLESSLSKTLDLDMKRRLSMIAHMKRVEKDKLNKDHRKRYSVMEQHFIEEKNLAERQLAAERKTLEKSIHIDFEKLHQKNIRQEYDRVNSLQKSLNAYNQHSDSKQVRRILRNHKQTIQFSNEISQVTDLRTAKDYNPLYGTLTNRMLQDEYLASDKKRQSQHEKKIMRRFNLHKAVKNCQKDSDSDVEADDVCGTNQIGQKMARERSIVALYDNQLNECK